VYWVAIGVPKETEDRFIFLTVGCGENESVTFSRSWGDCSRAVPQSTALYALWALQNSDHGELESGARSEEVRGQVLHC
jgi:hypothetical protein